MVQYIDYPSGDPNDENANFKKLGVVMVIVALVGGGLLLAASFNISSKSPDALYDVNRTDRDSVTSARVQVNPDLWRGKHETPLPDEPQRWTPPPAPAPEQAKPTTRP